jgi:hypothetical protein
MYGFVEYFGIGNFNEVNKMVTDIGDYSTTTKSFLTSFAKNMVDERVRVLNDSCSFTNTELETITKYCFKVKLTG